MALVKLAAMKHRPRGLVRLAATLTTDASGDIAATSIGAAFGRIVAIEYDPGTLATGADISITDHLGAALVTLTDAGTSKRRFRPTAIPTTNTGVALTPGAGYESAKDLYVAGQVNVAVAQGGNAGVGTLAIIVDEGLPAGTGV